MGLVWMASASRECDAAWFRLGLLRFLTRLSVRLNMVAVLRSCGSGCSGSSGSGLEEANGSTLRKACELLSKATGDIMLLVRGGCCMTTLADDVDDTDTLRLRLRTGSVDVRVSSSLAAQSDDELGDGDRRESSTMQGFPEKTTDTMRAMFLQVDGSSGTSGSSTSSLLSEALSQSEKSSAEEETSSSDER